MPKPQPAQPDTRSTLKTYLPGWLKNRVIQAAQADDTSINAWLINAILTQLNHGVPAPAPQAPLPTVHTQIRHYMAGESLIGPCGLLWADCGADENRIETGSGESWCSFCGVRCS